MSDKKPVSDKKPRRSPQIEVIRRPSVPSAAKPPQPVVPTPQPVTPTPQPVIPTPQAVVPTLQSLVPTLQPVVPTLHPTPHHLSPTPQTVKPSLVSSHPPRRSRSSRPPPTEDQINALAKREHVPARIAKGELEGKMKARIWRKLHAEEAKRFDQVYELMQQNPTLGFEDAFGVLQSGLSPAEFLVRKVKSQKKVAVKQARSAVPGDAVNSLLLVLIEQGAELSVVLAEQTLQDVLQSVERVAFEFKQSGRLEKLQVILLARQEVWERIFSSVHLDPQLARDPTPIIRQPERRAFTDPRPFAEHVGHPIELVLRNGLTLKQVLRAVGPFDLVLGGANSELLVPLHAIVRWTPAAVPN